MALKHEFYSYTTDNGWEIYSVPEDEQDIGEGIHVVSASPGNDCVIFTMILILRAGENIFWSENDHRWASKDVDIDRAIQKNKYATRSLLEKNGDHTMPLKVEYLSEERKKLVLSVLQEMDDQQIRWIGSSVLNYAFYQTDEISTLD